MVIILWMNSEPMNNAEITKHARVRVNMRAIFNRESNRPRQQPVPQCTEVVLGHSYGLELYRPSDKDAL